MRVQLPLPLKQFVRSQPYLYQKLCFWAGKRGVDDPTEQVNQYLTQLVLQADIEGDNAAILQEWAKVLSPQERITLAQLSPILIRDYPGGSGWYALQKGEYSVMGEPVLHEICHQGVPQAIITRNRYDCLILNARNLLIVDVDIGGLDPADYPDCAANCQIAISVQQALATLDAIVQQFPHLGFRAYRTLNGLRYLCTTRPFDPLSRTTHRLMHNLYVDPLYGRLCKFQATFRARLTPKPWRVEMDEGTGRFTYDRTTGLVLPEQTSYAVCHLLKIVGQMAILPQFESAIQVHDSFCRVEQLDLDLA
ncbi:MAG: hypothetical protein KME45_28675 [Stenomitos rutilans HA7619-LM2]|nr:hypothetical protein [Stenomitos rutilans HA7619-LM2]